MGLYELLIDSQCILHTVVCQIAPTYRRQSGKAKQCNAVDHHRLKHVFNHLNKAHINKINFSQVYDLLTILSRHYLIIRRLFLTVKSLKVTGYKLFSAPPDSIDKPRRIWELPYLVSVFVLLCVIYESKLKL